MTWKYWTQVTPAKGREAVNVTFVRSSEGVKQIAEVYRDRIYWRAVDWKNTAPPPTFELLAEEAEGLLLPIRAPKFVDDFALAVADGIEALTEMSKPIPALDN